MTYLSDKMPKSNRDKSYVYSGSPMKPTKRGYFVERLVINTMQHCSGHNLIPAKYGNKVWDCRCSHCDELIQIKSSNSTIGNSVNVTKASLKGTLVTKITFYMVHCKDDGLWLKVISPKKVNGKYFEEKRLDPWGNSILNPLECRIAKQKLKGKIPTRTEISPQKKRIVLDRKVKKRLDYEYD